MILSTLENRQHKAERPGAGRCMMVYMWVSVFCLVFYLVYDRFSHGVRSPYMTWLFAWPFLLGVLPGMVFWRFPKVRRPGRFTVNLYNSGVAAVTVSSLLRGIFEIAGTASDYQQRLMYAGGAMLLLGIAAYLFPIRGFHRA